MLVSEAKTLLLAMSGSLFLGYARDIEHLTKTFDDESIAHFDDVVLNDQQLSAQ